MHSHPSAKPTVDAPCVRNCCLDADDVCMGCGRTLEEIQQWHNMSIEQRGELLSVAERRRQARRQRFEF